MSKALPYGMSKALPYGMSKALPYGMSEALLYGMTYKVYSISQIIKQGPSSFRRCHLVIVNPLKNSHTRAVQMINLIHDMLHFDAASVQAFSTTHVTIFNGFVSVAYFCAVCP